MTLLYSTHTQFSIVQDAVAHGVYIAGPIRSDPDTATDRFFEAHNYLHSVFDTAADVLRPTQIVLPPDSRAPGFIANYSEYEHPGYMRECYPLLLRCRCIAMLPRWGLSRGATYEAYFAESLGMVPLFFERHPQGLLCCLNDTFDALARGRWVDEMKRKTLDFS